VVEDAGFPDGGLFGGTISWAYKGRPARPVSSAAKITICFQSDRMTRGDVMHRLLRPSLLSLLTATAACAGNTSSSGTAPDTTGTVETAPTEAAPGGTLRIENRTNNDMDI
jgi:hypothetical protein